MSEMAFGEQLGDNHQTRGNKHKFQPVAAIAALLHGQRVTIYEAIPAISSAEGAEAKRREALRVALQDNFCDLVERSGKSIKTDQPGVALAPLINYDGQSPYHTTGALPQVRDTDGKWHDGGARVPNDPKNRGIYYPGAWAVGLLFGSTQHGEQELSALAAGTVSQSGQVVVTEVRGLRENATAADAITLVRAWEEVATSAGAPVLEIQSRLTCAWKANRAMSTELDHLAQDMGYSLNDQTRNWQKVLAPSPTEG